MYSAVPAPQEIVLLLPGEMADVPADALHRRNAPPGIRIVHALQRALELTAREPQLQDKRVRDGQHSSGFGVAMKRRTHGWIAQRAKNRTEPMTLSIQRPFGKYLG